MCDFVSFEFFFDSFDHRCSSIGISQATNAASTRPLHCQVCSFRVSATHTLETVDRSD